MNKKPKNATPSTWAPVPSNPIAINVTVKGFTPDTHLFEGVYAFVNRQSFRISSVQATDGMTTVVCSPEEFPWHVFNGREIICDRRDLTRAAVTRYMELRGQRKIRPKRWRSADAAAAYLAQVPLFWPHTVTDGAADHSFVAPCTDKPSHLVERIHRLWPSLERNWPQDAERLADSISEAGERGMPVDWDKVKANAEFAEEAWTSLDLITGRMKADGRMALDYKPDLFNPHLGSHQEFTIDTVHNGDCLVMTPTEGHTIGVIHTPKGFVDKCSLRSIDPRMRFPDLHTSPYALHDQRLQEELGRQFTAAEGRDFILRSVGGRELAYRHIQPGKDGFFKSVFYGALYSTCPLLAMFDLRALNSSDLMALAWHATLDVGYVPIGVAGFSNLVVELPKATAKQDLRNILERIRNGRLLDGKKPPKFSGSLTDKPGWLH